jgi:RimJ/RimL family protein N-acetyltransferase
MQLKSKRILFREILEDDIPQIHQLNILPEVDKYNTLGIPKNIKETQDLIITWITAQEQNPREKYVWLMLNEEGYFIGLLGLNKGKKITLMLKYGINFFLSFGMKVLPQKL